MTIGCYMTKESRIVEDIRISAEWIAQALTLSGYKADFSPASLKEIDRFFDEHSLDGAAKPGGLLSEQLGQRLFALGAYVGEVLRRSLGGEWFGDDSDPEAEVNVQLNLPDGSKVWPIQKVMKRFKNGKEDSIVAYGAVLGLRY